MIRAKDVASILDRCLTYKETRKELKLKFIGDGAFRKVYRIVGTEFVVKFPSCRSNDIDKEHSRIEYQRCYDIMHQERWYLLRRYTPKVYYYNPKTGVLLMHYYEPVAKDTQEDTPYVTPSVNRDVEWIQRLVELVCREDDFGWWGDISPKNLGVDKNGGYRFIDMGLFEEYDS